MDESNKRAIAFFERFGFKSKAIENESEEKEQSSDDVDNKRTKMSLDLRIYRSSVMVLVKKELKQNSNESQKK